MTGARIEFELDTGKPAARLKQLLNLTDNPRPIFTDIADAIERSVRQHFFDQESPEGDEWIPSLRVLDAGAGGESAKTLINSGRLLESLTATATEHEAIVGTNVIYGAIHQFGGKAGRGHSATIPARPFLGIGRTEEDEILAIIARHIRQALR